jgi:ribose transport system ATP-binding protein
MVDGQHLALGDALAARAAGLRFVHQDLGLVDTLDAVDNVMLGQDFPTRAPGRIDWRVTRSRVRDLFEGLDYDIPLRTPVGELGLQQRTAVAIARALNGGEPGARILVFDEPTAAMTSQAVDALFKVISRLKTSGIGILYISHHLEEIFAIGDRVSVLRNGSMVATRNTSEVTESQLIELMVGDVTTVQRDRCHTHDLGADRKPVLQVQKLSGRVIRNLTFDVLPGEIVGFAGIGGSGRDELAGAIFGATPRRGEVVVGGQRIPAARPAVAVKAGLGLLTADRAKTGSLLEWSLAQNVTLPRLDHSLRGAFLNRRKEVMEVHGWLIRLGIEPRDPRRALAALSGGNQQRALLARWLRAAPQAVILDEPTQGVDVGAIGKIYETILEFASHGTAFVICSSDAEELALVCDRVMVLSRGVIVGELSGTSVRRGDIDRMCLEQADATEEGTAP